MIFMDIVSLDVGLNNHLPPIDIAFEDADGASEEPAGAKQQTTSSVPPVPNKPSVHKAAKPVEPDSSDEEEDKMIATAATSKAATSKAKSNGVPNVRPKAQGTQKNEQGKSKRITLVKDALLVGHPLVTQAPVEPALTVENATNRYVLVPASVFGCENSELGGWIGKVLKVEKNKEKATCIKFHDKKMYFKFSYVEETFKPLT